MLLAGCVTCYFTSCPGIPFLPGSPGSPLGPIIPLGPYVYRGKRITFQMNSYTMINSQLVQSILSLLSNPAKKQKMKLRLYTKQKLKLRLYTAPVFQVIPFVQAYQQHPHLPSLLVFPVSPHNRIILQSNLKIHAIFYSDSVIQNMGKCVNICDAGCAMALKDIPQCTAICSSVLPVLQACQFFPSLLAHPAYHSYPTDHQTHKQYKCFDIVKSVG